MNLIRLEWLPAARAAPHRRLVALLIANAVAIAALVALAEFLAFHRWLQIVTLVLWSGLCIAVAHEFRHADRTITGATAIPPTAPLHSSRAIVHDLRTKLSIITLQLDQIADPRARTVERDLADLAADLDELSGTPAPPANPIVSSARHR